MGVAGVLYFSVTYATGLVITLIVVVAARLSAGKNNVSQCMNDEEKEVKNFRIKNILSQALKNMMRFVPRILLITVPLYLLTAYARKNGLFEMWKESSPLWIREYLPPEVITIVCARFGGIFGGGAVAAELLGKGQILTWQAVYAMLIGNILTVPLRMLRRSIPAAMSVFPGFDGLIIVLTLQSLRTILTVIALVIILILFA